MFLDKVKMDIWGNNTGDVAENKNILKKKMLNNKLYLTFYGLIPFAIITT